MNKINSILYGVALMLTAACTLSGCSTADVEEGTDISRTVKINIGNFPTFASENGSSQTRSSGIGTFDTGKTAWADNDVILLRITDGNNNVATTTATYNNGSWTLAANTLYSTTAKVNVEAFYAPNYSWSGNALTLKDGKTAGQDEYLTYTGTDVDAKSITISTLSRNYARLRIVSSPGITIKFTCAGFTPVGSTAKGLTDVSLTTDAKGNAYLYGSWEASSMAATMKRPNDNTDYSLVSKTVALSAANKSYVISALPKYDMVGTGTQTDPYKIYYAAQLQDMGYAPVTGTEGNERIFDGQYIQLESDIDCSTIKSFIPIGGSFAYFAGNFDGQNHTISNLNLVNVGGLFGQAGEYNITQKATIKNVILHNPTVNCTGEGSYIYVGALVGYAKNADIYNCGVTVDDKTDKFFVSNNSGGSSTGGLVGYLLLGRIISCYANIPVTTTYATVNGTGGLVGVNNGTIIASYSLGNVTSTGGNTGGLVGSNDDNGVTSCTILSCYSAGAVSGTGTLGSIVGQNYSSTSVLYSVSTSSQGTDGVGSNSGTVTGCSGGVKAFADIRTKLLDTAAETKWTACIKYYSDLGFALPTEMSSKKLGELWSTTIIPRLKLSWEK